MTNTNQELLQTALQDYQLAYDELNRPAHDVMFNSVCHLSREAICSLLKMHLDKKGISYNDKDEMATLIRLAQKHDPELHQIDFNSIVCGNLSVHDDPANYCLNESRIHSCFMVLETLKSKLIDTK